MVKDVYLFTNGTVVVFDNGGNQMPELQGMLTEELKQKIFAEFGDGTRITFSRWKAGFFELTRAEFMDAKLVNDCITLSFSATSGGPVKEDEPNSPR